jgi:citrate synthase
MSDKAELHYKGNVYQIPVIEGTKEEKALDVSRLRAESGLITLDKGFKNTGSTESSITFLNGEEGILKYRGYSIEELAEKSSFVEVSYLLIYGELPTQSQLETFKSEITNHTLVHEDVSQFLMVSHQSLIQWVCFLH